MKSLNYTLLAEGPLDKALIPILNWLLRHHLQGFEIQSNWADLYRLPKPPNVLSDKIKWSISLYPCNLLFIHRDADNQGREQRINEIERALQELGSSFQTPVTYVIPVRMTEAWLLFDEMAIRTAASNPYGRTSLELPDLKRIESDPDPKKKLFELLRQASGLSGRRLKKFRPSEKMLRIAEIIDDFLSVKRTTCFPDTRT